MGKAMESATVSVSYRFVDGRHVFTSDDVYGLYVSSDDPTKAYQWVADAITKLLELNEGIRCTVRPVVPLREFIDRMKGAANNIPHPAVLASRQFVVDCH